MKNLEDVKAILNYKFDFRVIDYVTHFSLLLLTFGMVDEVTDVLCPSRPYGDLEVAFALLFAGLFAFLYVRELVKLVRTNTSE